MALWRIQYKTRRKLYANKKFHLISGVIVLTVLLTILLSVIRINNGTSSSEHYNNKAGETFTDTLMNYISFVNFKTTGIPGQIVHTSPLDMPYLPPYPSRLKPSDSVWQIVNGTSTHTYVYSAFYDFRDGINVIRVIGTSKRLNPQPVWCRMWYRNPGSSNFYSRIVSAEIEIIREHHLREYSACFILCPLRRDRQIPLQVSIVTNVVNKPENLIIVINNRDENKTEQLAMCVQPLYYGQSLLMKMLEFIEFYKILGVNHFTFYSDILNREDECLLRRYRNAGAVTMLPWHINLMGWKEIWVGNMMASHNDCLYRSMYKYSHVLFVDLDEFIIPRRHDTLRELIETLSKKNNNKPIGSYIFRNTFFPLNWTVKELENIKNPIQANLLTLKKIRRQAFFYPYKFRSKYIARPEFVIQAGIHFIWTYLPGYESFRVPVSEAVVQHYRYCLNAAICINQTSIIDRTALKYKKILFKSVIRIFVFLRRVCKIPIFV